MQALVVPRIIQIQLHRGFNMKKLIGFSATCALAAMVSAPAAAVTIYTNRAAFLAAAPGSVVTDFEENAPGDTTFYDTSYVGTGFTITASTNVLHTVDPAYNNALYNWGTGDVLDLGTATGTISLSSSVRAFGFDFGYPLVNAGSGRIKIGDTEYPALDQPNFNFFGVIAGAGDGPFAPTTINFSGGQGILDNFTVLQADIASAAPEPATWLMLLAGFGLVGTALRRRNRRSAAFA